MTDSETTFTVEVLGFPSDVDPETLAGQVSEFFGIGIEEGRRLVRKRPIRVKRHATAKVAQQLVKQLRRLGADVMVRNEQSSEERVYAAKAGAKAAAPAADDPAREPISSRESIPSAPGSPRAGPSLAPPSGSVQIAGDGEPAEETLESDGGNAPPEPAPSVDVIAAGDAAPLESEPSDPSSAPSPSDPSSAPSPSDPDARRTPSASRPSSPRARTSSDPGERASLEGVDLAPRHSSPSSPQSPSMPSLPPASAPIVGLPKGAQGKLDYCGSCNRPIERGDTCAFCGWNNLEKERHCRTCKKKLIIVSAVTRRTTVAALLAVAAIVVAAAVLVLFGTVAGVSALALCGALVFVGDALSVRYACKTCTVAVYSEKLQKEESARLGTAKRKALAVAAVCGVGAVGLFAGSGVAAREITDSSYGIAWTWKVPGTHSRVTNEVTQLTVPAGQKRTRVQFAERPYVGGQTYFLAHLQYTYPSGSAALDKAGLQAVAKAMIEGYFAGHVTGAIEPAGDAVQASFEGTFHNRQIAGRLHAEQYEHDMVIVAVTGGSADDLKDASVERLLGGVSAQIDAK